MAKTKSDAPTMVTVAPETDPIAAENARLKAQLTALESQQDQALNLLEGMQARLDAIEASGGAVSQAAKELTEADKLDRELQALKDEFADYPAIDVFERRVLVGRDANDDIRLRDEPNILEDPTGAKRKWKLRIFNFEKDGRATQAEREGYLKVEWTELRSDEGLARANRTDPYVRFGDRGKEVLCKMPLKMYDLKKKADALRMRGILSSESKLRDHLAEGVAGSVGAFGDSADQAGSFTHAKVNVSITPGETERVTF